MTAPFTAEDELERLLQLLYQCPVGLITFESDWSIEMINPAAVRMLAPFVRRCAGPGDLVAALELIVSDLRDISEYEPDELGRLHPGRRIVGTAEPDAAVEVILTRIESGRLMATVLDATPHVTTHAPPVTDRAVPTHGAPPAANDPAPLAAGHALAAEA